MNIEELKLEVKKAYERKDQTTLLKVRSKIYYRANSKQTEALLEDITDMLKDLRDESWRKYYRDIY